MGRSVKKKEVSQCVGTLPRTSLLLHYYSGIPFQNIPKARQSTVDSLPFRQKANTNDNWSLSFIKDNIFAASGLFLHLCGSKIIIFVFVLYLCH